MTTYIYRKATGGLVIGIFGAVGVAPTSVSFNPPGDAYLDFDVDLTSSEKALLDVYMTGQGFEYIGTGSSAVVVEEIG